MTSRRLGSRKALAELARSRGVAPGYVDSSGRERTVEPDSLVGVLRALGEDLNDPLGADECLRRNRSGERPGRPAPVLVAWDGRLPDDHGLEPAESSRLVLEDGSDATEALRHTPARGHRTGWSPLPFGFHLIEHGPEGGGGSTLVISSPSRSLPLAEASFGLFAPTYGLEDDRPGFCGDLGHLGRLGRIAAELGGAYVATLPLLADYSALERPSVRPSPYSPLTRLWWNEAYLDLRRLPELEGVLEGLRIPPLAGRFADVAGAAAFARPLLRLAAERLEAAAEGKRRASLREFVAERPDVERYAAYRAAAEMAGPDRSAWPTSWSAGRIEAGRDVSPASVATHVYAQWAMHCQLADLEKSCGAGGVRLLLDLPVGSQAGGYDPWAFPSSFAGGGALDPEEPSASVGAPPDRFFSGGQDWGFRPLHPEGERLAGYPVTRAALRNLLRYSGALRIDHVMSLQRLWWIPNGASPREGAYVQYRTEELLAIALLEAWRARASLVGEDLGTVDPELQETLARHGVAGMHVAVFDLDARPGEPLEARSGSVASVDTHDTATFAGWFDGTDVDDRLRLGMLDATGAAVERESRAAARDALVERLGASAAPDAKAVHAAVLEELGRTPAGLVLVNIEDLWGEHDPQNVPGTTEAHANFCRRLAVRLDELAPRDIMLAPLERLGSARRGGSAPTTGGTASKKGEVPR